MACHAVVVEMAVGAGQPTTQRSRDEWQSQQDGQEPIGAGGRRGGGEIISDATRSAQPTGAGFGNARVLALDVAPLL